MKNIKLIFASENGTGLGEETPQDNLNTEETKPEVVMIPKEKWEEIEALLKEKKKEGNSSEIKDLAQEIAKAIRTGNTNDQNMILGRRMFGISPANYDDVGPDDFMDVPAIFFAYNTTTTIFDDYVKGQTINCPISPIKFVTALRKVTKDHNGKLVYNNMCTATVQSKKQVEFLRKHSMFGLTHFESMADASKTITQFEAECLAEATQVLSTKNAQEIHRMALNYKMEIDTNDQIEIMRRVAKRYAKTLMETRKKMQKNMADESLAGQNLRATKAEE